MKKLKKILACVTFLAVLVIGSALTSEAASLTVRRSAANASSFTVSWNSVSGAARYDLVYELNGSSSVTKKDVGTRTSYTFNSGKDTWAAVAVAAYDASGKQIATSNTLFAPVKPATLTTVSPVSWGNDSGVVLKLTSNPNPRVLTAYEYQIANKSGKVLKSGSSEYVGTSVTGLSTNRVYKLRTRVVSAYEGDVYYGDWSSWRWIVPQPKLKTMKLKAGNKVQVRWRKVSGATKYVVYGSTKPDSGYKKVKTLKKNKSSYTVSKVRGKKLKKYKYYYFKVVAYKGKVRSTATNYRGGYIYTIYR